MTDPGPRRDRAADPNGLALPSRQRSVALLRRYAADACAALGWAGSADTVGLLVSEVATDAVLRSDGDRVRVRVLDRGLRLRVEVLESSPATTASRERRPSHEDERGLALVEALAVASGADTGPDGRTAWFEIGV